MHIYFVTLHADFSVKSQASKDLKVSKTVLVACIDCLCTRHKPPPVLPTRDIEIGGAKPSGLRSLIKTSSPFSRYHVSVSSIMSLFDSKMYSFINEPFSLAD